MKRKLAVLLLVALLLTTCMAMFSGCVDEEPKPREVELELVNPITGDVMKRGDTIDLPEEETPIEVRVKDKETGEYLTDDDIPLITLRECWHINFLFINSDGFPTAPQNYKNWPTREEIDKWPEYKEYEISIFFSCRPKYIQGLENFKMKYSMNSTSIRFYINKSWKENN